MNTKIEQFIVYPKTKNAKTGNFFDLALKNIIKNRKGTRSTLSTDVDKILYGKK